MVPIGVKKLWQYLYLVLEKVSGVPYISILMRYVRLLGLLALGFSAL